MMDLLSHNNFTNKLFFFSFEYLDFECSITLKKIVIGSFKILHKNYYNLKDKNYCLLLPEPMIKIMHKTPKMKDWLL
jgi:hypothetical protein